MNATNSPALQFERDFAQQIPRIESMLPPGMDIKRFMRTVANTVSTHAQADKLLAADRNSLFNACQKAAGDGLLIDGREATLVVFRDNKSNTEKVTYMPMVQGLVKLARNSGEISNIVAEVVYEQDQFTYRPGIDAQPQHEPDWFGTRGQPLGAYAVITTRDGEKITSVMPRRRIVAIGQGGRNADQYDPAKGAHYTEWWKKTVVKNVLKYAPKSTYLEAAIAADNEHIDPDKIPPSEDIPSATEQLARIAQGEKLTARTAKDQPPARTVDDRPDGGKLAGT